MPRTNPALPRPASPRLRITITITRVRVAWQAFFLALFVFLGFVTTFSRLGGYPASILLELDPFAAAATAAATGSLYRGLLWSLLVVVATLLLGRAFCGWVCPLGTLQHLVAWAARPSATPQAVEANRYRRSQRLKYYVLIAFAAAAPTGIVQVGLLDPIALVSRSFTAAVWPAAARATDLVALKPPVVHLAWLIAAVFGLLVAIGLTRPRFFCRVLCPLGALLGVLSRFALWRIARDPARCNDCERCLRRCDAAADPHTYPRAAECHVCFNCIDDCPEEALAFRFAPTAGVQVDTPDWSRRGVLVSTFVGLVLHPAGRVAGAEGRPDAAVIRPPGSLAEADFLARCLKCAQCVRVCPTSVLQPATFEAGLEGLWTPVLAMRAGYCELNCTLCGHVCPTGAIERLTIERKLGLGRFQGQPVRLGTAFFDQGRCLPWAMDTPCVVCEEVCPTSPKAIFSKEVAVVGRRGETITLRRPQIDPVLCVGCGICEHECPVTDLAGVRVTAVGETRSRTAGLLLDRA